MTGRPVLIIGAGPTGLVLALWLTKLGVRVRIIDQTAEPGTTSRAVAVQARTLELYRQVDLAGAVVEAGVQVAGVNLWVGGTKAARVPLGRLGEGLSPFPYALTYPQDAHERLLIDRLDALGVRVERRTELVRFDQRPASVRAVLKRPGARRRPAKRPISPAATARVRRSGGRWGRSFPVAPMPGCSMSPTWTQPARRLTAKSMSTLRRPISWQFFPSRVRAVCA